LGISEVLNGTVATPPGERMNILVISATSRAHRIGGLEDHLHGLSAELVRRGHHVRVLTARHPDGIVDAIEDGVSWRFLDADPAWTSPSWEPALRAAVEEELARLPADVIHSQSSAALPLLRDPVPGQPPIVLSLHGNYLSIVATACRTIVRHPSPRLVARTIRSVIRVTRVHFHRGNWYRFRRCEVSVPSSAQVTPSTFSHFLRRGHVHVVPSGVDTSLFRPRPAAEARLALGLPDAPTLLFVGRLDTLKGPHVAVEALRRLPGTQLVFVGDGPRRGDLEALAESEGVDDRVHFLGRLPAEGVADAMAACDIVLFPTLLPEAGPMVVAQAMASGRPVIASRLGAVVEMLGEDGVAGVLVRPGSPKALADAAADLLEDPDVATAVGARARARAAQVMTVATMADAMLRVYHWALAATDLVP
jgi:glycosyltransferase involved in cell wall biosynthesis